MNDNRKRDNCPVEFSGSGQKMLYNMYGDPRKNGWGSRWLLAWNVQRDFPWFPGRTMHVHRSFQEKLYMAFRQLERLGLETEIHTFNEAYNIRFIHGSDAVLSVHSWGAAIDLNAAENPLGSNGTWSKPFTDVMLESGIFSGQNWIGRKDPMHFSMVVG